MYSISSQVLIIISLFSIVFGLNNKCPSDSCSCEQNDDKIIINCRYKELDNIPSWSESDLDYYELTLSNNEINALPSQAFGELKIQRLDITSNKINAIDDDAFLGVADYLEYLTIEFANMNEFPKTAISKLTRLKSLKIIGINADSFPPFMFQSLPILENLSIENCGLSDISQNDFSYITSSLKTLSLDINELSELPVESIKSLINLEELSLSKNSIVLVKSNSFSSNSNLKHLDLSGNGIHTLEENTFSGLESSLTSLKLQLNKISNNQMIPIKSLTNLQYLDLSHNSLSNLPQEIFIHMNALEELRLESNALSSLKEEGFVGLHNLRTLYLQGNSLTTIDDSIFQSTPSLEELDLDNQDLSQALGEDIFKSLANSLVSLSLENTKLDETHWNLVKSLKSLTNLDLSKNEIKILNILTFQDLTKLESLSLSENMISHIAQDHFHGLEKNLASINLNDNLIAGIDECTFKVFEKLNIIQLKNNPLQCDCNLRWLRQWVDDKQNYFASQWKCDDKNKDFLTVSTNEFDCASSPQSEDCKTYDEIDLETTESSTTTDGSIDSFENIDISFKNISSKSIEVNWNITQLTNIDYIIIEYRYKGSTSNIDEITLEGSLKFTILDDLAPGKDYQICITVLLASQESKIQCSFFETTYGVSDVTPSSNLGLIIGCVLGFLCIIVLVVIVMIYMRLKNSKKDEIVESPKNVVMRNPSTRPLPKPTLSSDSSSKPFSKPTISTSQNNFNSNKGLVDKLQGFSPDEQNHIMNMLGEVPGNVQSVVSQRYVPDPTTKVNIGVTKNKFFGTSNMEDKLKYFSSDEKNKILELIGEKEREIEVKKGFNAFAHDPNIPFMDSEDASSSVPNFNNRTSNDFDILQINSTPDLNLYDYSGPTSEVEAYLEPVNTDYLEINEFDMNPNISISTGIPKNVYENNKKTYYNETPRYPHANHI